MNLKNKLPIVSIAISAIFSLWIYQFFKNPRVILQILIFLTVAFLIILRKSNIGNLIKFQLFQNIFLGATTLFVILLVVSTGGFLSPFFILVHLATLALSFLATLTSAMTLLLSSLVIISLQSWLFAEQGIIKFDFAQLLVYIFSLVAIIPLSINIARRYRLTGKLADILLKQLFLTKGEQVTLLGTIGEGVITLDTNFKITHINPIAQRLIKYDKTNVLNKNFFLVFRFFDQNKNEIGKKDLPLKNLLKIQATYQKDFMTMHVVNDTILNITFTLSSNVDYEGKVKEILFVFSDITKQPEIQKVLDLAFTKHRESQPAENLKRETDNIKTLYQFLNGIYDQAQSIVDLKNVVAEILSENAQIAKNHQVELKFLSEDKKGPAMRLINEKKIEIKNSIKPFSTITNLQLLRKGLFYLIFLSIITSQKNTELTVDSEIRSDNLAIFINFFGIAKEPEELLKPFFGKLENHELLKEAGGLEGYLAKTFLEQIGAEISVTKGNKTIFSVKLPYSIKY